MHIFAESIRSSWSIIRLSPRLADSLTARRFFISAAARLVNVTTTISDMSASFSNSCAIRSIITVVLPVPAEAAAQTLLKEQLDEVLDTLTEREQKVLRLRFGMNDGRARTLEEVGKEFDVTRERIRQIEAKALRKLRHPSRSRKLRDYLD